jgi:DNA-binding response OmpR family regulator
MKWHLLLIDDEQGILEPLAELLTEDDIVVSTATNGLEGLTLLKERHFDVVVSDISMPLMDGKTMLLSAKALGIFVPTIFFSAHADQKIIQELKEIGAVTVVKKPNIEMLSAELNSVLTRNQFSISGELETENLQHSFNKQTVPEVSIY